MITINAQPRCLNILLSQKCGGVEWSFSYLKLGTAVGHQGLRIQNMVYVSYRAATQKLNPVAKICTVTHDARTITHDAPYRHSYR